MSLVDMLHFVVLNWLLQSFLTPVVCAVGDLTLGEIAGLAALGRRACGLKLTTNPYFAARVTEPTTLIDSNPISPAESSTMKAQGE
jgi:hypothetical protein